MPWLILLVTLALFYAEAECAQRLRATRRLLRQLGTENLNPWPEPPSPHRLLGDVARPLAASAHGCHSANQAFRPHRPG